MTISVKVLTVRHLATPTFARIESNTMTTNTPHLPYASGCRHASPCANVYAGRACALDDTKRNGYDDQGLAYVEFVTSDDALGIALGSRLLAVDPYTGYPSGVRVLPSGDTVRAYVAGEWS